MVAPVIPPAPTRFSSTQVWPSCCNSGSVRRRPTTSTVLPAENGAMRRIVLFGQAWARAMCGAKGSAAAAPARRRN